MIKNNPFSPYIVPSEHIYVDFRDLADIFRIKNTISYIVAIATLFIGLGGSSILDYLYRKEIESVSFQSILLPTILVVIGIISLMISLVLHYFTVRTKIENLKKKKRPIEEVLRYYSSIGQKEP